ncbi:MAG: S8/S53 family peptidase [Actinomycetota bacterium]|nr:S8/S53 family peptidase [Actinomycetota bacterium]
MDEMASETPEGANAESWGGYEQGPTAPTGGTDQGGGDRGGGDRGGPPSGGSDDPGDPSGRWTGRVRFSETHDGLPFAYRPDEVITTQGPRALEIARRFFPRADLNEEDQVGPFFRLTGIEDPIMLVEELRLHGIVAQPNHVYFAHDSVSGNPVYGNPVYGNKAAGSRHNEPTHSSALPPEPVTDPDALESLAAVEARIRTDRVAGSPTVIVLDTGLAAPAFRPGTLGNGITPASAADVDHPDEDNDGYLDPAAGHGTFIAGIIGQIAPGCEITLHRVLSTFGDGDEWKISKCIERLSISHPHRTILSLSFGAYVLERPHLIARTIRHVQRRGVYVVASAGNDGRSRPLFPATLPDVLAVGALAPTGPAPFSNFGDWVDACAPGSELRSTFFVFDGPAEVGPYGDDPDHFEGWAIWSGTSFSAPVVVGNLARMMMADGGTTRTAVQRLIDAPTLTSVPYLGTVVDAL